MSLESALPIDSVAQTIFTKIADDLIHFHDRRIKRKQEYAAKRVVNSVKTKGHAFSESKRAVTINGIDYPSITIAALSHDISHSTVINRCNSNKEKFKDWIFHGLQTIAR